MPFHCYYRPTQVPLAFTSTLWRCFLGYLQLCALLSECKKKHVCLTLRESWSARASRKQLSTSVNKGIGGLVIPVSLCLVFQWFPGMWYTRSQSFPVGLSSSYRQWLTGLIASPLLAIFPSLPNFSILSGISWHYLSSKLLAPLESLFHCLLLEQPKLRHTRVNVCKRRERQLRRRRTWSTGK